MTGAYLYVRMDDEIRSHVQGFLADRYPQFEVSVGGARLIEGKGIAVYDISLTPLGNDHRHEALLVVEELVLVCDVELTTLMKGTPQVHRVEVKHPQLALRRGLDGHWNVESLLPTQPCGLNVPQVVIRGGALTISDEMSRDSQPLSLRDLSLTLVPTAQAAAIGGWPSLKVDGSAAGPQLKQVEIHAEADGPQRRCTGTITLHQLQINEALLGWVRPLLPPSLGATKVSGVIDGTVTATWNGDRAVRPTGAASLALTAGRLEDPRLPRPITDLVGKLTVNPQELKLEELRGKWGPSNVALSLNRTGWAPKSPLAISARIDGAPLDRELYRTLAAAGNPENGLALPIANLLREHWEKFSPEGIVDAWVQAAYIDGKWKPTAELTGRQLAFQSDKFAYRLTGGDGKITFTHATPERPALLDVNVYGVGGGQRIHVEGQVIDPRPGAAGWARISGEGLEIDEPLIAAVDQRIAAASQGPPLSVIASLHPAGKFNLIFWQIERTQPFAEPRTSMRLDLTDVRINYDLFPYPLREIRGTIESSGNNWTFTNFTSGGRRTILAAGHLLPTAEGPHELWLRFTGVNVPLDEGLYYALPEPVQDAWQKLRPSGSINLNAEVRHRMGQGSPNIRVAIEPQANSSLRPVFFSYLMEDVTGHITYDDGKIEMQSLKARHQDGVTLGANGNGSFSKDNGWQFTLTGLWADSLTASTALVTALPPKLRDLVALLRPSGDFRLHNSHLTFRQPASAIALLESRWDLQLECHAADFHGGIDLENVHGSVRLEGQSDELRSFSAGELALETVTYQGIPFTDVQGPMWVDESQCRLGKWTTEQSGQPERPVTGNVYGGTVAGNGWVQFGLQTQYSVDAAVSGADLNRLIVERFSGKQAYQGKLDASFLLSGEGPSLARLTGEGNIHVREANIYELPLLVSMLKLLRAGAPNTTAFNQCDVDFRIRGPHIYLDKFDFLGDVVDLYGQGETDFDQRVRLIFSGDFSPREYHIPLVKNFVSQTSEQFMKVYVDGTLSEPHVTTEAFPGINQMLQQIQTDLKSPAGAAPGRQAQRYNPSLRSPTR